MRLHCYQTQRLYRPIKVQTNKRKESNRLEGKGREGKFGVQMRDARCEIRYQRRIGVSGDRTLVSMYATEECSASKVTKDKARQNQDTSR